MYTYGENEIFQCSDFCMGIRKWLQQNWKIAITLIYNTKEVMEPNNGDNDNKSKSNSIFKYLFKYSLLYKLFGITFFPNPNVKLQVEVWYRIVLYCIVDKLNVYLFYRILYYRLANPSYLRKQRKQI